MLFGHAELVWGREDTVHSQPDNLTFTGSSDQAERPEQCPTMEDEAGTASDVTFDTSS